MCKNLIKLCLARHWLKPICAPVLFVLCVPLLCGFAIVRNVTIKADGLTKQLQTNLEKPEKIIAEAGFVLAANDSYRIAGGNKNVQDGSVIEVIRAKKFVVFHNNQENIYSSTKATVGEALKSIGIVYYKEKVYPEPQTPLSENLQIFVAGKNEELCLTDRALAAPLEYVDDSSLAYGTEKVRQEGKAGSEKLISLKARHKDGSVSTKELGKSIVEQPVKKIVQKGTAKSVWTPNGYKRYSKLLQCQATAYTATGNNTALGFAPYEGIVAVDPRYIPLYTKLYIPGYGMAMAGDTGGDMVGSRIDLYFSSYSRAIEWGRRDVDVYILEE